MLKCVSENESRLEVLRVAIGTGAQEGGIPENRLQSKMIAEDKVIKYLWNDLGIPGASRVYRESNLRPDTECGVHRTRDLLIEWDPHTRIDTIDSFGNDAGADVAFVKKLQLKCHRTKSLF